jgi:hypothetical protein
MAKRTDVSGKANCLPPHFMDQRRYLKRVRLFLRQIREHYVYAFFANAIAIAPIPLSAPVRIAAWPRSLPVPI